MLIGKQKSSSRAVQTHVVGEPLPSQPTFSFTPATTDVPSGEHVVPLVEQPISDQPERVEEIQQGDFTPTTTMEQRRFSAPQSDWDPAR